MYGTLYWMDASCSLELSTYEKRLWAIPKDCSWAKQFDSLTGITSIHLPLHSSSSCFLSLGDWAKILKEDMVSQRLGLKMMKTMILMMMTIDDIMETLENKWKKLILNTGQYCILRGCCCLCLVVTIHLHFGTATQNNNNNIKSRFYQSVHECAIYFSGFAQQ